MLSAENGDVGADVDGEIRIFRGEKRAKLENATTRSDARCIGDNKARLLRVSPFSSRLGRGKCRENTDDEGGRSWLLKFEFTVQQSV